MKARIASMAIIALVAMSCGADDGDVSKGAAAVVEEQEKRNADLTSINPCELVTDDEIAAQVDLTREPSQRQGLRDKGAKQEITKEEVRSGPWPKCNVSWRTVDPTGHQWSRGDFIIHLMNAGDMAMLGGLDRRADIPGLGDEAYYHGYAPFARKGNISVGIEDFPDTHEGNGAVEMVRAALQRLPR